MSRKSSINYITYNVILTVLGPLIVILQAWRFFFSGKSRIGWQERRGRLSQEMMWKEGSKPRVWIHAVSAGEVVAAVPILRELKSRLPHHDLFLSTVTQAGRDIAEQQASPFVKHIFFAPFDLFPIVRRIVKAVNPVAFISLESEMWPNLLHCLQAHGVVNILVNGRISERSFKRIQKYGRSLFGWMLGNIDAILVQSEADAARFDVLCAEENPKKIRVLGNSKFDQEIKLLSDDEIDALRKQLHLPLDAPIFIAGSTRSEEEEVEVVSAYRQLLTEYTNLCLIVAPRQIHRGSSLMISFKNAGLNPILRSSLKQEHPQVQHLILDTMGELANIYAVATFVFVGNSFEPVVKGGGQNLLQPLAHGKPVFYGPRIATIRSEAALAQQFGVGFQVANGLELAGKAAVLLRDSNLLLKIATDATALIDSNKGVSGRYADAVLDACGLSPDNNVMNSPLIPPAGPGGTVPPTAIALSALAKS